MFKTIISIGTNVGNRKKNILKMREQMEIVLRSPFIYSPLMETEPIEVPQGHDWYFNQIMMGRFNGTSKTLLKACQEVEQALGRDQKGALAPRNADIDILLIEDHVINEKNFIIPHPQILKRRFCIEGIVSLAPDWIHPVEKLSFMEIYKKMDAELCKQKIQFIKYMNYGC